MRKKERPPDGAMVWNMLGVAEADSCGSLPLRDRSARGQGSEICFLEKAQREFRATYFTGSATLPKYQATAQAGSDHARFVAQLIRRKQLAEVPAAVLPVLAP
jgi:hypothetical protein